MEREPMRVDMTFIVRVSRDAGGRLSGIVERPRTGEKHRFRDASSMAAIIERVFAAATEEEETRPRFS